MNAILEQINSAGLKFVEFALPMLVQSVVLIVILLLTDFAMRKKVRAVFRYWIWLLVLVKLVLPTSLSSPMSLGHFFGDRLTYVDRTETPSEPQANLIEPVPVNVPPFIDLADIDTDRFAPTVPPPIAVTEKVKESAMTSLAAPPAISVTPLSWRGAVFLIWLAAVFAMTLLLLQRAIFVRGLVAQAKEVNGSMTDMLESCRASMSVKRKLGLKISANAASPAVCGLFSPVILVPQNLASSLTANQLKAVLLHELAHIRRGDLFVNLAQTVLQIVYFYNPMLWLANCIIRRIREQAVDEMVLVAMGEKAPQYPQTLVSVAKLAFKRPVLSLRLIGIVESKSALSGRIKHILNRPMPKKAKLGIIGLVVVVIIGAVLLPMANSMSDSPKLVIKGVVKDAQTDEPIAGAKVFDDGYAHEPLWEQIRPDQRRQWGAITNSAGQYSFLTWPEHHSIKVEAPGYKSQRRSLYKGHFVFKTKDEEIFDFTLEPEKVSDSSEFKATLPNDVTVELIGICEHPSEGKQWWRPDGSLLEDRPYDKGITHSGDRGSKYELAFRVVNLPDPAFGWTVKSEEITVSVLSEVGKDDHDVPDIWSALVGFQEKPDKKDIRIGIAAGPWTGSGHHHTGGVTTTSDGIVFQRAVQDSQGNIVLNIIHNINQSEKSYRVIAIGENGAEYTARNSAVSRPAQPSITEAVFKNLKLSDVKEFFFQTRPYQWVEFKNVALKPNFKTDVQVEVEGARSKAPQPAGNSTNTVRQYFSRLNFRQTPDKTFVKTLHEDIEPFEERVGFFIRDYNDGVLHCIDFDNNEIVRVPDKLDINDRTAILKWAKENNVDAMFRKASSLVSINMASVMTENSETDKLSSNTLEKLSKKAVGSTDILYSTEDGYTYYAFKTSQDRIGVVGLFSSENEGLDYRSLLMSYKLLKTDVQVEPGDSGSNTDIKEEDLTYPRKVFSVYGIVTDEQGNPISDVKVSASCGIGTLFRTGETITGEIGHYKLYFGPGIRRRIQDTDQWGAGFQAATIYAQKSDLFEANLCQHGNLAMSGRADYADYYKKQMKYYKGVVLPDKPYRLDFVMLPAATIKGKLVDKKGNPISGEEIWLAGNELYPSTNALETIKTDKDGMFTLDSVPCKSFWFTHRSKRDEVRTRPINFSKPMEYEITLVYDKPVFGKPTLTCISFQESRTGQRPDVQVENKKKKPSAWLVLLPRSPIRSAKELYLYFWGSPLVSDQMKIDSFELEIRSAKENVRMVRIDCKSMITVHSSKGEVLQWSMFRDGLPENMIRRIGPLEDGEYLIAIYVNGIRSSNVAKFTVDSSFESSNEPTLQVVPLVPAPGKKLQYFGLRATGPTPQDSELTNMALHFPDIIVDGVPRKILARNWSGPVYPLKPGQQHEEILMLKYYKPEIDLSRKHTVKAVVGKYESAPIEIGFDYSLELAWDKATTTIKSRPPRPPVLEGRVIGPDGKPGIGYRVCLYADPGRNQYIEYSDKDGKYDFPNVPTGRYKLTCQPKGNSEPALTFEQFQIEANKTVVQELNLEGKYAFSGKVTYEDGSPAAGVKIVGRWEIRGGNVFRDLRVTDENGFYELAAPFKLARYISLSIFTPDGTPAQGSYEHIGVMGPRTDVDFVVKRREIHASIWPKKFARMGGKHPGFQPVPVPEGWSQTRLLETLYKYLKAQGETKLPGCIVDLKDGIIQLSHNTRDYNIIRPGNAKRTGMQRGNDRGIGPEPDGLILTVHLSDAAGQFDRPHIIDRSPWTGFISQVYLPDIKLYLNVDIQYGTGINEKLLTDLCAPTSWLKTIFNNFNERTLEQKAWGEAVEKGSQPDVQAESEIDRVIEDYGQTRLLSKKEMPDTDNWVLVWGSVVKNNGRYLVPNEGLTLKDLIKAAGYNKGKLAESYVELIRRSRQGNITARSNYSRNLKTLLSGEESDIVLKPNDAVAGGYIEPSADGVEFWSGYHFSEVVELIVNDDSAKINMFADLDAGKLITPPDTLDNNDENAVLRWIKENGIDVMGETAAGVHGLAGFNMYAARVDNYFWDAGPQEFTDRLMVRIDDPVLLSVENLLPVTYLIKTSKYKMGILQILGFTENPKGIKIRYKLLNKEAAPKTDVLLTPEPVTGNWQYIGQSIPPDYNDIITLTEHINLGSIGHDAEGKTFITIVRDGQEDRNSQYRFVLFTTNGDILEPDGHIVLSEGKRSEEKFTFDEPFITRQLKGFRFQIGPLPPPDEPPPSEIDNTSLQLQKPVSELIEGDTLLPPDLPPPGRYAIELDGVDDYLLVPDSPSLRLEPPFTIEMWIKTKLPPDASEYRGGWAVISKGFTVGTPRAYLTGFGINLHRFPKEPSNLHIDFCKANNSGTYSATYAGYPLTNGVSDWIHITHVFDGEYYKSTPGHPLVMGKFLIPINDPFKGLLGEVRLWYGARTRQELRQNENVALTGNEPGLAACWTFEQTEGQFAYDISGNNNHARLGKFTGPDDADPKWIDLQAPSPQPDQKTDPQSKDIRFKSDSSGQAVYSGEISGRIVDRMGKPIAGAQVALSTEKIGVKISNGELLPLGRNNIDSKIVRTDSQGRFNFEQKPSEGFDLIVTHEKGFAQISSEDITAPYEIRIQPWGRIEGQLAKGRKAVEDKIALWSLPNPTWLVRKSECNYEAKCDGKGSFTFEKVPSGWFEVGYLVAVGEASYSFTCRTPVEIKSGQRVKIVLGGSGRPVIGKFVPPQNYDKPIYFGQSFGSLSTVRLERPRPENYDQMTKRQRQQWYQQWRKTDEYRKYRDAVWFDKNRRHYAFNINKNGSFRIEDVIAGEYQIMVSIEEHFTGQNRPEEIAAYYGTIKVPEVPDGQSDEPLDLGELELTMHNPLRVGDFAPLFEAITLNGEVFRLIDYRGKYVLLSFWQPISHSELEQLWELYNTYGNKGQLEIIGLGGNDTPDEVKNFVKENDIPWPQIYTGEEFQLGIARNYGGFGVFLISPDGSILAKDLRGENLKSTVYEILNAAHQSKTEQKTDVQVSKEILENIQVLRQSRLGQINETSIEQTRAISAMQELVRIGELAVPDLVSELRRDNNWLTKSLIAFVLRAIGDERVVPVLIEVLRQSEYRGEYGIHIQDDESAKWMLDRQHQQPDDGSRQAHQIIIACPVVEITAALEKITGHTEGHEHYGHKATAELGRNPPHEQWQKRVREIVREVADRWQKWIDLQTPSPQPNRRTDLQVEDKKRETEISGFVVDENGSSIAGATVTLLNKDLALLPKPERIGRTMRMVVFDNFYDITDTNGRFEFLDFNPGKTDIIVESQGYRTEILRDITTGTKNLKITLGKPSAYALAGEVIDGKGNPISGVEITLAEKSYKTVRTDEEGEFRFAEILEPTTVHRARALFAHKEGFGIWGKTLDTTGGETYVKITLLPEEKISGLVVDQVGRPITNATVLFWSCRGRDTDFGFSSKWREIAPRTETDTNGRFTLTGIPTESDVCIRAMAMSYASSALYCIKTGKFGSYAVRKKNERGTLVYGSNREPSETIEFKLKKAVTLIGTLTYEDSGRPAPGLRIATQSHKASQWAETRTDQAGRFRLEGVSPNPCNLLVIEDDLERDSLPQWTAAAIVFDDLKEGETRSGIRLVLTKGGIIRGKAVDAEGNPLHGIDIAFYSAARPRPGAACQSTLTVKDGTWAYRFPPGEVYVYIRTTIPEGKWSRKIYNLHLNDGQVIDNIDFELSQVVPENSPYRRDIIR